MSGPPRLRSEFVAEPPQWRFWESQASVKGYGGAMGGGKSRTLCEAALSAALDYPGIQILMARQRHTTIIETTRRTMMREVLAPLAAACDAGFYRKKESQGEDWLEFFNGSRINFIGLDDPVKWYSSEIGLLVFDEAHEIAEEDVVQLMTRLRQRGMPHRTLIGFNPGNPGHWLQEWFILGASETEFGFYKPELTVTDADAPIGDCEFVFANAYQNPHLPPGYIDRTLKSLPALLRRRLLEGQWVLTDGSLFFDAEALSEMGGDLAKPRWVGETGGNLTGTDKRDPIRVRPSKTGPLAVWKPPVRKTDDHEAHRYVVSVDVSSGGGADYSAVQVLDLEEFEQVAELQIKIDPDLVAVEAFRLACIYNGALIAPEITGGWGYTIVKAVEKLLISYKGASKPRLFTRRIEDRLAKKFTDVLGWDTNTKTRMVMLDTLEEAIRDRSLRLNGQRTYSELKAFARDEKGRPAALAGKHDDLVISLAIAVYLAVSQPRQLRRLKPEKHEALVGATGY